MSDNDSFDDEILNVFRIFSLHQLRFIVIGGFATNFNGFQRVTADLDILIEDSLINRQVLRKCMAELDLGDYAQIETMPFIPGWTEFRLNSGFPLDIMTEIKGLDKSNFQEYYEQSTRLSLMGIEVPVLSLDHLLQSKRASARPKDLLDIEELEKIKKLKGER